MRALKYDPLNIVICGIGGQGNVLASELVASVMTEQGYRVAVGETYGASQRGGAVMSHVRVSLDKELAVLIPRREAHMLIGFEPLEALRNARRYAGQDTLCIYDPRPVYPLGVLRGAQTYPHPEDLRTELEMLCTRAYAVPAADIALACGDARAANIVLLGAFAQLPGAPLHHEELEQILRQRFTGAALDLNEKALILGRDAVRNNPAFARERAEKSKKNDLPASQENQSHTKKGGAV